MEAVVVRIKEESVEHGTAVKSVDLHLSRTVAQKAGQEFAHVRICCTSRFLQLLRIKKSSLKKNLTSLTKSL